MTKVERADLVGQLVAKWLKRYDLTGITITTKEQKVVADSPAVVAQIVPDPDYLRATLLYAANIETEDANHVICHEMAHLILNQIGEWVCEIEHHVDTAVRDVQQRWWFHAQEQTTEKIARLMLEAERMEQAMLDFKKWEAESAGS